MRSRVILLAVTVAVTLVVACGTSPARQHVEPVEAPGVPAALRFQGPTLSDGMLDLSTLAGAPVVLWFWSPPCTDCAAEAATAEVFHHIARGSASVVGVTCSNEEAGRRFEEDHGMTFPTLVDGDGTLTAAVGIACQPAWALVGTDREVTVESRTLDLDELGELVDAARGG